MKNYFNTLNFRQKITQLKKCRLLSKKEFNNKTNILKNKNIVIIGCGAQGLNQGLNMRDSGLNISYALREDSINKKNKSWLNATKNNFKVGNYNELIPTADLIINLTPDKQHRQVIDNIQHLIKKNAILGYSHGFNIVETGQIIRQDITVIMVAPKCPGTEVREEYNRGFGVPALIAVHDQNDPWKDGLEIAKSWAYAIGSHKAGVLESSFIAEVKSDLMGEQTILCGLLQTSSLVLYKYLIAKGHNSNYVIKLLQHGWEILTESLKHGGIKLMLDRLSNSSKIRACQLSNELKTIFTPLFKKHMDDIISGQFSSTMIDDWNNKDKNLLMWREKIKNTQFEKLPKSDINISEEDYFNHGTLMVSILKAGVELSFEIMVQSGIKKESAYYESLHELPLIANTISRKRFYEMNMVISDTAEYGSYLFTNRATKILNNFLHCLQNQDIGDTYPNQKIDNINLQQLNDNIQNHPIEKIGKKLRSYMVKMKSISNI
ncbi:Ketol-acid reductoisomerase (NADP(+)) [Buchnera aphidicola (Phyllaphis fagi)]|uniref:ketol-acid reductoisomerase n=1 Tax=Buchnera aphidicola TaxID=9 RepID=UPI0034639A7C